MTARALLAALEAAGCEPAAGGIDLLLASDPHARLTSYIGALHTGVRAALTGRPWVGTLETGAAVALDPGRPVPAGVLFLAVDGDAGRDRVRKAARALQGVFAPAAAVPPLETPNRAAGLEVAGCGCDLSADPAFAEPTAATFAGLSDRLLAALRRRAAAGCRSCRVKAVGLADYLAACDAGHVMLGAHPADATLADWNRRAGVRQLHSTPEPRG